MLTTPAPSVARAPIRVSNTRHEARGVFPGRARGGRRARGGAERGPARFVVHAGHDGGGEPRCGGRIAGRQGAGLAVDQPVANAADVEGSGWHARTRGFEADQSERLRPRAGDDEQVGVTQVSIALVRRDPSGKRHRHAAASADARGATLEVRPLGTVADDRERQWLSERLAHLRQRVEQEMNALDPLEPSDREQGARRVGSSCGTCRRSRRPAAGRKARTSRARVASPCRTYSSRM